jgi:hypothetical protein
MSSCCAFCMWYFIAVETILESSRTDSIGWWFQSVLHGYDPFSMNLLQNNPSFDFVLIKSPQECDLLNEPWWSGYFETVDDVVLCSYS